MNQVSEALVRWLERTRRTERTSAVIVSLLALGSGTAVFLLLALLVYAVLCSVGRISLQSVPGLGWMAVGLTGALYARIMLSLRHQRELYLDPMGLWILKDIGSFGPRLLLEGLRQVRRYEQLGEFQVVACAQALAYLAAQKRAVTGEDVVRHCPQLSWERLRAQLGLLDGVLFLGEDAERVTLMGPFRLRLRAMLGPELRVGREQEPARPQAEAPPPKATVNEPETLSAYEILGLSPTASLAEIKAAYRKRLKECHPDLFAGMDQPAKALAERWTKALNAAYATLNPRHPAAAATRPR